MALTQSGNLYSWGHFEDGRLGVKMIKGQSFIKEKNQFTCQPQLVSFTHDHIDSIGAAGSLSFCIVSGTSDLKDLNLTSSFNTRTYLWGKVPKGVRMDN